jgi:hypothetical protein
MLVEEGHKRAVGDEGRDAVGFIEREFERADPQKDDRDGDAYQRDADPDRNERSAPSLMTSTSRTARCGPACRVVWSGGRR